MRKFILFISAYMTVASVHAQIPIGVTTTNTVATDASAAGDVNDIQGQWAFGMGTLNGIANGAYASFVTGHRNFLGDPLSAAMGSNNSGQHFYNYPFGEYNNCYAIFSYAFGRNNHNYTQHTFSLGENNSSTGWGNIAFVFGKGMANDVSHSFLVGFETIEPALHVTGLPISTGDVFVGIGTYDPTHRFEVHLGDEQHIRIQPEVANTNNSLSFRHSDGTQNWKIRAFSNFPGGYNNILSFQSAGSADDLWIACDQTLIGDYFDFSSCSDCDEYELFVKKGVRTEALKIDVAAGTWADYVFDEDYDLMSIDDVQAFVKENGHLPGVPSAEVMEKDGLDIASTDAMLLQKIEELTLHLIEMNRKRDDLKNRLATLQARAGQ